MEEYFPGFMAFTDCSAEQPIPRPKNWLKRKIYYSGKKKKHTSVKNLYTVNQKGWFIYKTKHRQKGRKHDYNVYNNNRPKLPTGILSLFDLGFLGVNKDFPQQKSSLPIKKEKGYCELTTEEKEYNRNHSAKRIVIEHAICKLKKYIHENHLVRWLPLVSCLAYNI